MSSLGSSWSIQTLPWRRPAEFPFIFFTLAHIAFDMHVGITCGQFVGDHILSSVRAGAKAMRRVLCTLA